MISYGKQKIDPADIKAVVNVLKSDWLTQGPKILEFERALAKYCNAKYAVAVVNGTAALHLAYLAAAFKPGDEIITTPNSFVATTNMMLATGAKPVFADIHLDTYNLDESKIEKLVTKKTKAIVPVDFSGQPADLKSIKQIAKKHRLLVIEDASHALGASHFGKNTGNWADLTIFSFHAVKSITTGEGGAILTNNKKFYQKSLFLRNHGLHKNKLGLNVMTALGYNYRLTDLQAALGISQLKKINSFIKKRRQIVAWYRQELQDLDQIILPQERPENYSSWHLYVIRTNQAADRDKLGNYLIKQGIGVNYHYPAIYKQPYYQKIGYKKIKLVNEEIYQASCLTLPCHALLAKTDVRFISQTIKNFFANKAPAGQLAGQSAQTVKILITGSTGLLGSSLLGALTKAGCQTHAFKGDITKSADLKRCRNSSANYDWIIHAAAITSVLQCDKNKTHSRQVNVEGTRKIVALAKFFKAKLLYISTASVFSGQTGDYRENDQPRPLNYYSRTKREGEKIALKYSRGLVLRLNLIGIHPRGSRGLNFLEWLYDSLTTHRDIKLFQNVIINPLSNWTLAALIAKLIKNKALDEKILHLGSRDHLSKAGIGRLVKKYFPNYRGKIQTVGVKRFKRQASEANQMWLNIELAQKKYHLTMPLVKEEIDKIFNNLKTYGQNQQI